MTMHLIVRASRRAFAEGGVDLRQRRAWFADEADGLDAQTSNDDSSSDADVPLESLPAKWQKEFRLLRKENADRRAAEKKLQEEREQREQQLLAEQGNFKALAEKQSTELARLKALEERAQLLETALRDGNDALINRVPQDMRKLIPADYSPEKLRSWLDANMEYLLRKPAPDLDAGVGGAGRPASGVEVAEKDRGLAELASRYGYKIKPEDIAKRRNNE